MKIKKKELIQYIKGCAEQSEKQAYNWSDDGYFDEAYKAQVIANFLREELAQGIENDFVKEK
jgi:hypothetical protein